MGVMMVEVSDVHRYLCSLAVERNVGAVHLTHEIELQLGIEYRDGSGSN